MADDLDDLRARVAAARERLTNDVDFAQKVELRLNDLARIVEGSLARQSAELEAAQSRIAVLDEDLSRALSRAEQAAGDAARADRLAKENGDLRAMVMTLLEVIEGRQKSSLSSVMQQLEENVSALVAAPAVEPAAVVAEPVVAEQPAAEQPIAEPAVIEVIETVATESADAAPEDLVVIEDTPVDEPSADDAAWDIPLTESAPAAVPDVTTEDEIELEMEPSEEPAEEPATEAAPSKAAPMEDLSEIALYDASEEVVEPTKP